MGKRRDQAAVFIGKEDGPAVQLQFADVFQRSRASFGGFQDAVVEILQLLPIVGIASRKHGHFMTYLVKGGDGCRKITANVL